MNDALVDANFFIALAYPKDAHHAEAVEFVALNSFNLLVPSVILPEMLYILRRLGGTHAALRFGETLIKQNIPLIDLTGGDFERAIALMRLYQDAELDFVDSCLTAIAERLNIRYICTFDRRDFSMIRPQHVDYFQLLP